MPADTTILSPAEEVLFQRWIKENIDSRTPGFQGWEEPDSKYDMRGFFHDKEALSQWKPGDHGPDTYKQHGHPTFSVESKYSRGLQDGGQWIEGSPDERGLIQPPQASHGYPGIVSSHKPQFNPETIRILLEASKQRQAY